MEKLSQTQNHRQTEKYENDEIAFFSSLRWFDVCVCVAMNTDLTRYFHIIPIIFIEFINIIIVPYKYWPQLNQSVFYNGINQLKQCGFFL